jgi:hypothetical protein
VLSMQSTESATALTDYALAVASLGFAIAQGRRLSPRNQVSAWFWCAAFIASAVAAAAGGAYHAFVERVEPRMLRSLWNLTMIAMGACGAFATAGIHSAYVTRKDGTVKWLVSGIVVTLAGATVQQGPRVRHFSVQPRRHVPPDTNRRTVLPVSLRADGTRSTARCARCVGHDSRCACRYRIELMLVSGWPN